MIYARNLTQAIFTIKLNENAKFLEEKIIPKNSKSLLQSLPENTILSFSEQHHLVKLSNYFEHFEPLPHVGETVIENELYQYKKQVIKCRVRHIRQNMSPLQQPKKFIYSNFPRTNIPWIAEEKITHAGILREYKNIVYYSTMANIAEIPSDLSNKWKQYINLASLVEWNKYKSVEEV